MDLEAQEQNELIFDENKYVKILKKSKPIKYIINERGCWICISHCLQKDGYPKIKRNNKTWIMSRYIYQITKKEKIPDKIVVMHTCDTPQCINPEHLILGTVADNINDALKKGRAYIGEKNPSAKLTREEVMAIRNDPRSLRTIAKDYNMKYTHIGAIKRKKVWAWL